jgi:chromosome segregation ATPase
MNGEIKMLKKVLTDNVNINVSHMANRTAGISAATSSKYPTQVSSHQSPSKGGSENMVKTLAELRAAKETIAQLEKKIVSLNEDTGVTGEMEDQLCELEDQLLKANEARVEGISQNTHLQERVSELEDEVGVVTEEATLAIQELERMLDELTEKHDNVLAVCEQKDILIGQFREDNASQKRTIARLESEGKSMSEAIDFIRGQVDEAKIEIAAKGEAIDDAHLKEKSLTLQEAQMRDDYAILHHKYHELTAAHVSLEAEKAVGDSRITLLEEENACLVLKAAEGSAQIDRLENDLKEALLHRDQAAIDGSNDATALEEYRRRFIELEGKHTISLDTLKSENISIEAKLLEAIGRSTEMENELKLSSADLKRLTTEQRACVVAHEGKVHQLESMLETVTMERNEAKDFIQILEEELVAAKSIADFEKKDQSVDLESYTPNQLQQDMEFLSTGPEVRSITELENDQSTGDLENQLNAVKSELVEMEQSYGNLKEKHLIMKLQEEKEHHFQLHELQQKLDEVNKIASKVAPLEATIRVLEGTNNSIQDANEDVREFNGKEEMQNDIDVLLAKMVVAEREFEEVQNEHETEVNALENSIKSMDKVIGISPDC